MINYLKRLRIKLIALNEYWKDYRDHIKFFSNYNSIEHKTKSMLECQIMLLNHQLEKAQTYASQKKGYGKEKIKSLISYIEYYISKFGYNEIVQTSLGVIDSHFKNPYSFKSSELEEQFKNIQNSIYNVSQDIKTKGGIEIFDSSNLPHLTNLYDFLLSRRSCRTFSDEQIDRSIINTAVDYAMTAPSACNRQCVRVHYYDQPDIIKQIIESQKSDIGWCLGAKGLIIITANKSIFRDYFERNQKMFDAGLFSMLLVAGLHNNGIGSCFKMAQKNGQ